MKLFDSTESLLRTGLVIVFPAGVKGLFNPSVHSLVREVEEKLDGVHVTYALSSGASPTIPDALAAVRFAGCASAVVIYSDENVVPAESMGRRNGDWSLDLQAGEISANGIIDAFETARGSLRHAA